MKSMILFLSGMAVSSLAFGQATPSPAPTSTYQEIEMPAQAADTPPTDGENPVTLSKPQAGPVEPNPGPSTNQKPSQGEGEKAPVTSRPTAVPDFSLPEVVITGQNELTINAQRLSRAENDVTLGSHDLTGVERSLNDLPGLSKTFTALATEEAGPSKGAGLVLHLGGGTPGTYGGWGLFGQEFRDFQYLLSGFDSNWGGEATGSGFDGDKIFGLGGQINLFPMAPQNFLLSGNYRHLDAELPYQGSIRELHDGLDLSLSDHWKLSDLAQARLEVSRQSTGLNDWANQSQNHQTAEWEADLKLTADALGTFFNRFTMDLGGRHATSDFASPAATGYDWGWLGTTAYFKGGESFGLTAKIQAQGGGGDIGLPWKFFPDLDLTWRVFGNSKLSLYWKTDRYVESFYKTFMDTEHVAPVFGFPSATEVTGEWGGRFTQKLSEAVLVSLSASTAQIQGYHQWTDLNPTVPVSIQDYSTLAQVQMSKAAANVQWNFKKDWQLAATYQWTQGLNLSGDGKNLTNLPTHRGILSLYRGDDTLETRLELQVASERLSFESLPASLPAYAVLGLDATWHFSKTFSLWFNGDNLWGQGYEIQPGYLEPQYHVRGGVEVIF